MHLRALLLLSMLAATGCKQVDTPDFGAHIAAVHIVDAQNKCAAAEIEDLGRCTSSQDKAARMAAKTALEMVEIFNAGCEEELGLTKCDEMLKSEYYAADKENSVRK